MPVEPLGASILVRKVGISGDGPADPELALRKAPGAGASGGAAPDANPFEKKTEARIDDDGAAGKSISGRAAEIATPEKIAVVAKSQFRGFLDAVREGRAEGWAFNPARLDQRVLVEIWCDDACVTVGVAEIYRQDLKNAGFGDGKVHFSILLPADLHDGNEHIVTAKIAGTDMVLKEARHILLPREPLSGTVEAIDGATLRGSIASRADNWRRVDLFVDNRQIANFDVAPNSREAIACELPTDCLDGRTHWFQFKASESSALVGEAVAITPLVSTPEAALQRYARSFPAMMSANAPRRYAALEKQIAIASHLVDAQADGPDKLTLPVYLEQVALAHAQVMYGVNDRPGKPAPLTFLQYAKPKATIVIPAHNKFWVTYNCLAALILAPNQATAEIIVVDDGSSDLTKELENIVKGVRVVRNESAQGFIKSSNRGAEAARGEFVVMLNNDTEPCSGWLDELIYVFEHFDDVGLVGAKLVYPDGKLQEAGGIIFPNFDAWNYGRHKNPNDPRFNYIRQIDYCSGACIMLRQDVWRQLNGFDEFYTPAYYEDTDIAFRVRALGLKTFYTPFAEIIHFEGVSSGTSTSSGVKRFQAVNEPKFRSRWAPAIRRFPSTLNPELAKDRGVALRALVIDAQPPQPDRDAGSYAAIQEMRILQALGVKLTFLPQNLAYLGNYTEALQRMGVECLFAPYQTSINSVIEERGAEFDFFYITRYSVAERYIEVIRRAAPQAKIVFCNADLHFLREIRAAIAGRNPEMLAQATRTRELELDVMRRTDVTLSYTDTEAAVIASHNLDSTKVMKCPWVVEPAERVAPLEAREGLAFLGNYQHPPNEEAVTYFVKEVMPELRRRLPGVKFHIFGSNMPERMMALASDDVVIEGFVDDVAEVYDRCRVFVAPLRSGAGIKGKVIGALAAGTPSVISPLAAEGVGISAGSEAFIAESTRDWVEAISSLYLDKARWLEMSERARAFVSTQFSFERGLTRMRDALAVAGVYTG